MVTKVDTLERLLNDSKATTKSHLSIEHYMWDPSSTNIPDAFFLEFFFFAVNYEQSSKYMDYSYLPSGIYMTLFLFVYSHVSTFSLDPVKACCSIPGNAN